MVSMLDCIKRVPSILDAIVEKREETFAPLWEAYGDKIKEIDELVLVGSGTSNTSCITARYLAERYAGVRVTPVVPSEFLHSLTARNPKALYVFVSQTGTSTLTNQALAYAKENGWMVAAVSEAATTPIAKAAGVFLDMRCGYEEYPMRTIGYSATVLTLILLGIELGVRRGHIDGIVYEDCLAKINAASSNIPAVIDASMEWLDRNRRKLLQADGIMFSGSGSLYGVALEGAVKVWETPQIISVGYELEEGMHGPNFGYTHSHSVIVLNDGGVDNNKAIALGKWMKLEKQNGFLVGAGTIDEQDLPLTPKGGEFCCLEFAAVVQVIAYRLAFDQGRDLFAPHDNSVMYRYFKSHDE